MLKMTKSEVFKLFVEFYKKFKNKYNTDFYNMKLEYKNDRTCI